MRKNKIQIIGAAAALATTMALPAGVFADNHEDEAEVRVGHFSPDAPAVDVYANGGAILSDVPFGVISQYLEVPAGTYTIEVVAAGADPADGAVIGPIDLDFTAGTMTTVAATNTLENIEAKVLLDEPMPEDGIAEVRVVHFSADAPAVDIALDGGDVVVLSLIWTARAR